MSGWQHRMEDYGGGQPKMDPGLAPDEQHLLAEFEENLDPYLQGRYRFGRQAEEFLRSTMGKYLLNKAEAEIKGNLNLLLGSDKLPDSPEMAEAIQKMRAADRFIRWCGEVMQAGLDAESAILSADHGDDLIEFGGQGQ